MTYNRIAYRVTVYYNDGRIHHVMIHETESDQPRIRAFIKAHAIKKMYEYTEPGVKYVEIKEL